jgi:hypothetical protein
MKPSPIGLWGGVPWTAACALSVLLQASVAQAAGPSGPACKAAYQDAQRQEHDGHLVEARQLLGGCARAACGKAMHASCTEMFNRVDIEIPTIVPRVVDDPRTDIEVKIDGQTATSALNGESIALNPGLHELTFAASGNVFATRKVMIVQGVHDRSIAATMHAADNNADPERATAASQPANAAASGEASTSGEPREPLAVSASGVVEVPVSDPHPQVPAVVPWLLAGVGVAGVGVSAWLFSTGKKDRVDMAVDSAAVGVGALAVAIALFATSHSSKEAAPAPTTSLLVDVQPLHQGAYASVGATF